MVILTWFGSFFCSRKVTTTHAYVDHLCRGTSFFHITKNVLVPTYPHLPCTIWLKTLVNDSNKIFLYFSDYCLYSNFLPVSGSMTAKILWIFSSWIFFAAYLYRFELETWTGGVLLCLVLIDSLMIIEFSMIWRFFSLYDFYFGGVMLSSTNSLSESSLSSDMMGYSVFSGWGCCRGCDNESVSFVTFLHLTSLPSIFDCVHLLHVLFSGVSRDVVL